MTTERLLSELQDLLAECEDYFEPLIDCEFLQDGPNPNREMVLYSRITRLLEEFPK